MPVPLPSAPSDARLPAARRSLGELSRAFFSLIVVAVVAHLVFLALIHDAFQAARHAGDRRDAAMALVDELRHDTDRLARLVRTYVMTADPRYLRLYYDILAIQQGKQAAPGDQNGQYWEQVIAGLREHRLPRDVPGVSLAERLRRLDADASEQAALAAIVQATEALGRTEQIAFAATQGLYDPVRGDFVSDGRPDPAYAQKLLYSKEDRKSTRLNSSHSQQSRMPSSA